MPPNPACRSLSRQDLKIGITNRLRGLRHRSIVVVCNYGMARYVGTISGKSTSFTPSSILFRPRSRDRNRRSLNELVEPPGTAPGSDRFITTPVYRHSRPLRDGTLNIGVLGLRRKAGRSEPARSFRDGARQRRAGIHSHGFLVSHADPYEARGARVIAAGWNSPLRVAAARRRLVCRPYRNVSCTWTSMALTGWARASKQDAIAVYLAARDRARRGTRGARDMRRWICALTDRPDPRLYPGPRLS